MNARDQTPLVVVALAALAPVAWLHDSLPLKGVDSFFSLRPQGRLFTTLFSSAWDSSMSAGEPSNDHIWVVFNLVQGTLSELGLSLNLVEMIILTILSTSSVVGAYRLGIALLPRGPSPVTQRFAASCVAIIWVANPFALSFVWFHQLATEVTWAVVPWLVLLLRAVTRNSQPMSVCVPLIVLTSVLGSAGLAIFYLPAIMLLLAAVAVALVVEAPDRAGAMRRALVFFAAFLGSMLWWLVPSLYVLSSVYAGATAGPSSLSQFEYESQTSTIANVLSLTAIPQLYATVNGIPYVSWASFVTIGPGQTLRFLLPATAIYGVAYGFGHKAIRAITVATAVCVLAALLLSKGNNPPLPEINQALLNLPYGAAFRHPVDKFSVLIVLPLSILFGFGLIALLRDRVSGVVGIAVSVIACVVLALPWWSGTVIPEGGGLVPSARVDLPSSYKTVGDALANSVPGGKTMVLPYSPDQASAFHWRVGIQPNADCILQDWAPNRTLVCHGTGNQYANRVGDTMVSGIIDRDPRVLDLARLWGIDRWLVHQDWALGYMPTQTPPGMANAFLRNPLNAAPADLVQHSGETVTVPATAHFLALSVRVNQPPATRYRLLQLGSIDLQVNRPYPQQNAAYFELYDAQRNLWAASTPVSLGLWHTIVLSLYQGRIFLTVDGVDESAVYLCENSPPQSCLTAQSVAIGSGMLLGGPLSSIQVIRSDSDSANVEMSEPSVQENPSDGVSNQYPGMTPRLIDSTKELNLWAQPALPLVYAATSVYVSDGSFSGEGILQAAQAVSGEPAPVVVSSAASEQLDRTASTSLNISSPTAMKGMLQVHGTTVLVLSESYDNGWQLAVDGQAEAPSSHIVANGFANAWVVSGTGSLRWHLTYVPQQTVNFAYAFAAMLVVGSTGLLLTNIIRRGRKRGTHTATDVR